MRLRKRSHFQMQTIKTSYSTFGAQCLFFASLRFTLTHCRTVLSYLDISDRLAWLHKTRQIDLTYFFHLYTVYYVNSITHIHSTHYAEFLSQMLMYIKCKFTGNFFAWIFQLKLSARIVDTV